MGCGEKTVDDQKGSNQVSKKSIKTVLNENTDRWMEISGVVGTAIGEAAGRPCIKIYVVKKTEKMSKQLPAKVEGFPVIVQESGEIRAIDSE